MKHNVAMSLVMAFLATFASSAVAAPTSDRLANGADGQRQEGDALLGLWRAPTGELVVELTRAGSGYVGKVVASPKHPEFVGKALFRGLSYDAAKARWRGQVFAPKRKEYVPASIRLERGALVLTAGSGFFTKTVRWSRAR